MTGPVTRGAPDFGQADLTNCDREPIHIPGSIQPHGAMLVYDPELAIITHASANAAAILGVQSGMIIGQPLEGVIGVQAAHSVRNATAKSVSPSAPGLLFGVKVEGASTRFDVAAHRYQGRTFVEFQQSGSETDSYGPLELTRALVRRLADEQTVPGLARAAARMVSMMLGYDRVMIYKMLHNGAGRVIAEQKRPDLGSFLGLHFPASDIPAQARDLYKRNWIRMISDVRYTPSPVLPPIPQTEAPLDMSYAQLRSVSPVHCEYLQNMGVGASMSISILADGELWGLIACHHYSPKVVPLPQRVGAELFGQYFSLQVETLERRERYDVANTARSRLDRIVAQLPPEQPLHKSLSPRIGDLAQLLPCDGAALWINGAWIASGVVMPEAAIKPVTAFLDSVAQGALWHTNQLQKALPEFAAHSDLPAGLLAVPVSHKPRDYLLFFRSEESRFVEWAGEPEKVVGPLGDRLTPRKSFDLWREEVRGQATPWTDQDLAIADATQNYLRDVVLRHTEATAEERRINDVRRKLINEELNHRVKNILSLVKSIVEQSRPGSDSIEGYSAAIVGRLQALAIAHDQIGGGQGGSLRQLLGAEVAAYGGEGAGGRITLEGPPVRLSERAYSSMALVAHELLTNAAKYGSLSNRTGVVRASWRMLDDGGCELTWEESGGPPVTHPARTGFGSTLIARILPFDLGGEAEVDYAPAGVKARLVVPPRHLQQADEVTESPAQPKGQPLARPTLAGKHVLLVEDQILIALDAESCLRSLGAAQVFIAPTAEQAIKQIAAQPPDLALLDVNLGDHTSAPVAEELRRRGVPLIFATGYGDTVMIPESMRNIQVLRKPYDDARLAAAVAEALGKAATSP